MLRRGKLVSAFGNRVSIATKAFPEFSTTVNVFYTTKLADMPFGLKVNGKMTPLHLKMKGCEPTISTRGYNLIPFIDEALSKV